MSWLILKAMERGLLWLPLLGLFSWLTWAGWNEYRKLEAYKVWAASFERAKYDIYAALGQTGETLVWGRPTQKGVQDTQEVLLRSVTKITLSSKDQPASSNVATPNGCDVCLELTLATGEKRWIPFTDAELALRWQNLLQSLLESLESTPHP
ncbi:MAG: hypothetical protein ACFBSF_00040 [Leptolyngbyaceae cyanobacterium]